MTATHQTLDGIKVVATFLPRGDDNHELIDVGGVAPDDSWNFGHAILDGLDPADIPTIDGQPIGGPIIEQNEDEEVPRAVGWNAGDYWVIEYPDGTTRVSDPASFEALYTELEN